MTSLQLWYKPHRHSSLPQSVTSTPLKRDLSWPIRYQNVLRGIACSMLLGLASSMSFADDDKPRYVHEQGADEGDCRNSFRPCASIDYALAVAGKGDSILVGKGHYELGDADALFRYLSASSRLYASRNRLEGFSSEDRVQHESVLIGLPPARRQEFEARGFRVIVDRKSIKDATAKHAMLEKIQANAKSRPRSDCIDNRADIYRCENINLLAQLSLGNLKAGAAEGSDIWGFQDLNTLREYVIVGLSNGVSVVDVTDPENPQVISTHNGSYSSWRDIKILQNWNENTDRWEAFAYVTTESDMGLMILDLRTLPNYTTEISNSSDFSTAHNVYLGETDYSFGVTLPDTEPQLVIAGSNRRAGDFRIYSLQNPSSPTLFASGTLGYMHDAASIAVGTSQKSACPNGSENTNCSVLTDFNEDQVRLFDVSVPSTPELISWFTYENAQYVHSGWWSEDGRYLFVHDELDEFYIGLNTRVRVFDMSDLANPEHYTSWVGPNQAIDHNGFVRGNRYYMSNYTMGLTVLDISDPASISRAGYLDTVTASDSANFAGAWGVYPFLPSGVIAVSDIESGLFLMEDQTTVDASLQFSAASYAGVEGDSLEIRVNRTGSNGALTTEIEVLPLNAGFEDINVSSLELNWADGESGEQVLSIDLLADADLEGLESLALRLVRPQGNASFRSPHISLIHISESGDIPLLQTLSDEIELRGLAENVLLPVQRKQSGEGEVSVDWSLEIDGTTTDSGTLSWSDGELANKTISVDSNLSGSSMQIRLQNPTGADLANDTVTLLAVSNGGSSSSSSSSSSSGGSGGGSAGSSGGGGLHFSLWILLALLSARRFLRGLQ